MAVTRRLGVESSEVRAQLIEAAAQVVRDEGCAEVTARRLAERFGLKRQIVHYYFGTIDDLLVAVIRREAERARERVVKALEGDDPLQVIWEQGNNAGPMIFEFTALATRRPAIQAEVKRYIEEFRALETEVVTRWLAARGLDSAIPPKAMTILLTSVSQVLANERLLDVSDGHAEITAVVENWLAVVTGRVDLTAHPSMLSS